MRNILPVENLDIHISGVGVQLHSNVEFHNVACYHFKCCHCPTTKVVPVIVIGDKKAPDGWVYIKQDEHQMFMCQKCAKKIGVGV